jgi:hypothetical protein
MSFWSRLGAIYLRAVIPATMPLSNADARFPKEKPFDLQKINVIGLSIDRRREFPRTQSCTQANLLSGPNSVTPRTWYAVVEAITLEWCATTVHGHDGKYHR